MDETVLKSAMRKRLWTAFLFCTASCLVSLYLGQDSNYDLKGYHIYNAWAVLTGRWSRDFFAAGPSTYFSPFLDVPYYLVASELFPSHGALVVALAGIPYGILLYFIYLISRRIACCLQLQQWDRGAFVAVSIVLGGTGAATWSVIGTTFNDITVAAIVLAAFHQIVIGVTEHERQPSRQRVAVAGVLLGLAMGLKLTAAIYVAPMAVVIFWVAQGRSSKIERLAIYGGCTLAAFAVVYGPWGWRLYELTGNPFFPLLNGIFHSDWMTSINVRDERFLPKSWPQWVFYPFYWATLKSSPVTEVPFRDLRLAIAYVLVVGYVALVIARRDLRNKLFSGQYRAVHVLVLFLTFSYILWLRQFSVLRYVVGTECLAGIFIAIGMMAIVRTLGRHAAWATRLCLITIAGFIVGYSVSPQWGRAPLGTDILGVQAPSFDHGALLIFADQPMSFLAPGLAATSEGIHFMTIPRGFSSVGQLGADGFRHELGRRMKAKIAENTKSLYVLFHKSKEAPARDLAAFDIEIDRASCEPGRSFEGLEFVACRGIHRPTPKAPPRSSPP